MKKRILGAIFIVGFLVSCTLTASSIGLDDFRKIAETKTVPEEVLYQLADENITEGTLVMSFGPVSNRYMTANITNASGGHGNIEFIKKHLNGPIPFLSRILPIRLAVIFDYNYTMDFVKRAYMPYSRYSYFSIIAEFEMNESSGEVNITEMNYTFNKVHTIQVTNFSGAFYFYRARLFSPFKLLHPGPHRFFVPAEFALVGLCDNAEFIE